MTAAGGTWGGTWEDDHGLLETGGTSKTGSAWKQAESSYCTSHGLREWIGMGVEIRDTQHNWKNEGAQDPWVLEHTRRRAEHFGEGFKGCSHLEWCLKKVEEANCTDKPSINTRLITE